MTFIAIIAGLAGLAVIVLFVVSRSRARQRNMRQAERFSRLFAKFTDPQTDIDVRSFEKEHARRYIMHLPWKPEDANIGAAVDAAQLGREVGSAVKRDMMFPFRVARTNIPERVFFDPYVAGYATYLTTLFGAICKIEKLSPEERGKFYSNATEAIVGSDHLEEYASLLEQGGESFLDGMRDATLYGTVMYNPRNVSHNNSRMQQVAEILKEESHLSAKNMPLQSLKDLPREDLDNIDLVNLVKRVTLQQHYARKYEGSV